MAEAVRRSAGGRCSIVIVIHAASHHSLTWTLLLLFGATSECVLVGCGDDFRHSFGDDGFPTGIVNAAGDPEVTWRSLLTGYGTDDSDVDCMIDQIFDPKRTQGMGIEIGASAEELNAFAAECDIDTSGLHYTND